VDEMTDEMNELAVTKCYVVRNAELGDLFNAVASATEQMDGEEIDALKPKLEELRGCFPDNELIEIMDAWIKRAEELCVA